MIHEALDKGEVGRDNLEHSRSRPDNRETHRRSFRALRDPPLRVGHSHGDDIPRMLRARNIDRTSRTTLRERLCILRRRARPGSSGQTTKTP
jgi:hypothetical protein